MSFPNANLVEMPDKIKIITSTEKIMVSNYLSGVVASFFGDGMSLREFRYRTKLKFGFVWDDDEINFIRESYARVRHDALKA